MSGNQKTFSLIFNAAIFILLEIAALGMLRSNGILQDTWAMKGAHALYACLWGKTESIKYYFSLQKENARLAEENFNLAGRIRDFENRGPVSCIHADTLSRTAATTADSTDRYAYMQAEIVKISNNSQHNYIIVEKGSEEGVVPLSGIITGQGVIGIIDAVSRHYSYGISFKNTDMTVSARIGKTGPVGSLVWDGIHTDGALLNEIPHHIGIESGDTVYTSGFSSIFPPDIPLGTTGESRIINGATYEIRVRLFEDFKALRYVTIVRNRGTDEISSLVSDR